MIRINRPSVKPSGYYFRQMPYTSPAASASQRLRRLITIAPAPNASKSAAVGSGTAVALN
jgi:hypothetical protein